MNKGYFLKIALESHIVLMKMTGEKLLRIYLNGCMKVGQGWRWQQIVPAQLYEVPHAVPGCYCCGKTAAQSFIVLKTRTQRVRASEVSETTLSHLQCSCARNLHIAIIIRVHHSGWKRQKIGKNKCN